MTDTLRTRIAAALKTANDRVAGFIGYDEMADAVIRELKLTQQWLSDGIISDGEPRPWELPCETRYATEWEKFDE